MAAEDSQVTKFFRQLYFMCKKNLILQIRYWPSTVCQTLIGPLAVLLILFAIQSSFNSIADVEIKNPPAIEMKGVSKCIPSFKLKKPCITVMYTPAEAPFDAIMRKFSDVQANRGGAKFELDSSWTPALNSIPPRNLDIVAVPDGNFIYNYTDRNPNITAFGLVFNRVQNGADTKIEYQLWYNSTLHARRFRVRGAPPFVIRAFEPINDEVVALTRGIDEAIYMIQAGVQDNTPRFDLALKDFPDTPGSRFTRCPRNPEQIFQSLAAVFLYGPAMVIFLAVTNTIVAEKENRLKDAMDMVGLVPSVFWLSHFISAGYVAAFNALAVGILGLAFGFSFFQNTDFGIVFFLFFLFNLATIAFSMFVSSLTRNVKAGIGFGIFFVIVGFIYCAMGSFVTYLWYTYGSTDFRPGWVVLMFFPFFNYNKLITDIFAVTSKQVAFSNADCFIADGGKFGWSELNSPVKTSGGVFGPSNVNDVPYPGQSLWLLFMNIIFWSVLALYLDQVVPNENGYSLHPLFFLFPSYYGFQDPEWMKTKQDFRTLPDISKPKDKEDPDVVAERQTALENNEKFGLRLVGLHKRYDAGYKLVVAWLYRIFGMDDSVLYNDPNVKCAINELSLTVNKGDMLALLGSNGAGKTSTMKILYGVSQATRGDAYIFGMNLRTQMGDIRKQLGVCPQFDLLFPDLTAKEHVELFCGIKGIPEDEMNRVMEERLKHMKLWNVRDQRSGQYSGGMKRRLSVILSTLGDPQCVFLDEPTTGMDPVNKRYVWSFLENFKKGRVIVLTTHSMEEADILGDKIAIMSKGRLKAIGKSIKLKNRFGSGYRIALTIPNAIHTSKVKEEVQKACPEATLIEEEYVGGSNDKQGTADQNARLVYGCEVMQHVKTVVKFLEECSHRRRKIEQAGQKGEENDVAFMIASFGMSQATLEDVFLKLIK